MNKATASSVVSTGPKTKAGKKVASLNATKHGLTAKNWLNEQERDQYQTLLNALVQEYELQTPTELMLAERVANIATRSKRFQVVEDALFAMAREQPSNLDKLIDSYELDHDTAIDAAGIIAGILQPSEDFNYKLYQELLETKDLDEISGYSYVVQNMPELRKQLFRNCRKEHCDIAELTGGKGSLNQQNKHNPIKIVFAESNEQEKTAPKKTDKELDESGLKVSSYNIRAYIREQIAGFHRKLMLYHVFESHKHRKELLTNSAMPSSDEMDRLMRYQTSLDRQFSKALGELLHVIDRRKPTNNKQ